MAHDIKASTQYAIVTLQLAINDTDPNSIADGLNDLLNPEIGEGWIADYALLNTDEPFVTQSSPEPDEGELFDSKKLYTVCVQDSDGNEDWVKVETALDLDAMDDEQLLKTLSSKIVIGGEDTILIADVSTMQRVIITDDCAEHI